MAQGEIILQHIKDNRHKLDKCVKTLINKENKTLQQTNNVIIVNGRIYIPKDEQLREDIMQLHHDSIVSGHPGNHCTLQLIERNYWWPYMQKDVLDYVKGCEQCQHTKPHCTTPHTTLIPHQIPKGSW
jgi:hypothetical protein